MLQWDKKMEGIKKGVRTVKNFLKDKINFYFLFYNISKSIIFGAIFPTSTFLANSKRVHNSVDKEQKIIKTPSSYSSDARLQASIKFKFINNDSFFLLFNFHLLHNWQ